MDKKCNEISENTPYEMQWNTKPYKKQFQIGKIMQHFILLSTVNTGTNKEYN
jgi:hypothetical protein